MSKQAQPKDQTGRMISNRNDYFDSLKTEPAARILLVGVKEGEKRTMVLAEKAKQLGEQGFEDWKARNSVRLIFDWKGVTIAQIFQKEMTQSTAFKLAYNNYIVDMSEEDAQMYIAKGKMEFKVAELFSSTRSGGSKKSGTTKKALEAREAALVASMSSALLQGLITEEFAEKLCDSAFLWAKVQAEVKKHKEQDEPNEQDGPDESDDLNEPDESEEENA